MFRKYAKENKYSIVADLAGDEGGASGASFDSPQLEESEKWQQTVNMMSW